MTKTIPSITLPEGPLSAPGATSVWPKKPRLFDSDGRASLSAHVGPDSVDSQIAEAEWVLIQTGTFVGPDGRLSKIRTDAKGTYPLSKERATKDLHSARWVTFKEPPHNNVALLVPPPATVVRTIMGLGEYPGFPTLRGLKNTAFLANLNGEICRTVGYHAATGFYLVPDAELASDVPEQVTQARARAAFVELLEVVTDMPMSDTSRSAVVAAILSAFARALTGPTPLFAVLANIRSAGKSLLASLITLIVTGVEHSSPVKYTEDETEFEKRFAAVLRETPDVVLFDNVVGRFGGATLNMALTAQQFTTRELGQSRILKVSCEGSTMLLTGNNCTFDGETVRRTCRIELESKLSRPELRTDFTHPDIVGWVKDNRSRLVTAALTILRGYCQAGRPDLKLSKWGSFQRWSDLVRNAIVWSGGADPYANTFRAETDTDSDGLFLSNLIPALREFVGRSGGKTCGEIVEAATRTHPAPNKALSAALDRFKMPNGKISARMLGKQLLTFKDRRIDDLSYITPRTVHNQQVWCVARDEAVARDRADAQIHLVA